MDLALQITAVVLTVLTICWVWVTVAAELPLPHWPLRMWDFPRIQALAFAAITFVLYFVVAALHDGLAWWEWIVPWVLLLVMLRQLHWVWPYLQWAKQDVSRSDTSADDAHALNIVISNVLTPNDAYQRWRDVIGDLDVDIIACAETDQRWVDEIGQALSESHPHTIAEPRDNLYGMALWSRLPLHDAAVEHVVQDDIPSIHGQVELRSGERVHFHCLHPRPPAPQESDSSAPRDAELIVMARRIAKRREDKGKRATIVMGDLNDVAWSRTTQLFQQISGLLDPRRGRGLFNSFHAHHWWVRFPLDHVLVSPDFRLIEMKRLPEVGSDHFPILIRVALEPTASEGQEGPVAEEEDLDEARTRIQRQVEREANGVDHGHVGKNAEAHEHDLAHDVERQA
ncbi:MAG: endonuclease/exonuclease/phosphatase family protein [Planctomycetota bacterium]